MDETDDSSASIEIQFGGIEIHLGVDWSTWTPNAPIPAGIVLSIGHKPMIGALAAAGIQVPGMTDDGWERVLAALVDNMEAGDDLRVMAKALADVIPDPELATTVARGASSWGWAMASLDSYQRRACMVEWLGTDDSCDLCVGNAAAGPVRPGDLFPSGHRSPPAHPRCRCCLIPAEDN